MIGHHKSELDTPCLLLDQQKLQSNLVLMQNHVKKHHKAYRPHCKTHKSSALAKWQLDYGANGLCVTVISEAEALVASGLNHILITSPVSTIPKLKRLERLLAKHANLLLVVDSFELVVQLNELGARLKQSIDVLIDIDGGIGRTGIAIKDTIGFAQAIHQFPWLNLRGIQRYAGHIQHTHDFEQRKKLSCDIMNEAGQVFETLKSKGFKLDILTGGGTGTYDIDIEVPSLTEIQPGSYAVMDVEYHAIASKHHHEFNAFKPALTLLTSVVSANHSHQITVDAGTKAIYVDSNHKPKIVSHPGLSYDWSGFGDEHGKITGEHLLKVGDIIEMIVPHCDPTINLYDHFYIMENDVVVDMWRIDLRGHKP